MDNDKKKKLEQAITSYMHKSEIYPTPRCIRAFVDILEQEHNKRVAVCAELEELQSKYDDLQEHNMQLQSMLHWDEKALAKIKTDAFMAGQADCGVDPSYSSAKAYADQIEKGSDQ